MEDFEKIYNIQKIIKSQAYIRGYLARKRYFQLCKKKNFNKNHFYFF